MLISSRSRGGWLAIVMFAIAYAALYWSYLQIPEDVLNSKIYYFAITAPCAVVLHLIAPADSVSATGSQIVFGSSSLEIVRGCDGVSTYFLLVSAIVSIAASWRRVFIGVVAATVFVYLLNQCRIVALYFILTRRAEWFSPLHSYVFPTLFVLAAVVFFTAWASPRHDASRAP